jgi:very-short-patch-repair endonuclease
MFERSKLLRQRSTPEERTLWAILRNRKLANYKFRRQHNLGFFVADFYCPQVKLVIEIDGENHRDQKDYDDQRTIELEGKDYKVLRFTNVQVRESIDKVLEQILDVCRQRIQV